MSLLPYHKGNKTKFTNLLFQLILQLSFANNLPKEMKDFCLSVCQCVSFKMITVVVEIYCKSSSESSAIIL